jgi:hypothetical protein
VKRVFPLAFLSILALLAGACGGGKAPAEKAARVVHGNGYRYSAPMGSAGAEDASVKVFHLRKPYDPAEFAAAAKVMDRIAKQLRAGAGETVTVDGRKARAYSLPGGKRIGFVLAGSSEYQLYCPKASSGACSLLFQTFRTTG